MTGFYKQAAAFARQYEAAERQAALAAEAIRHAQLVAHPMGTAFNESWSRAAVTREIQGRWVSVIGQMRTASWASSSSWVSEAMDAGMASLIKATRDQATHLAVAGVGAVTMPKLGVSSVGEVALSDGTNAWGAIVEQLRRIGALPCGQIYGIVLFLVLLTVLPELPDDIAKISFAITVANLIIRTGQRDNR